MFISPAQTNAAYYSGAESATTATGVVRVSARGAIPPVEAAEKDAASQNQQSDSPVANGASPAPPSDTEKTAPKEPSLSKAEAEKQAEQQQQQEDQVIIDQLKARDREVRVHEAAHAAVGGQYAGSPSYEFTRGPDGKNYATAGEVGISVSEANDPQATIEKARVIQAAALAPAQPSAQDRLVAAEAARMELNAQAELQQLKAQEAEQSVRERESETGESESDDPGALPEKRGDNSSSVYDASRDQLNLSAGEAGLAEANPAAITSDTESQTAAAFRVATDNVYFQQFQQQGPVDVQHPYGKSGQLHLLA